MSKKKEAKPEVRNVGCSFIEVNKDPSSSTWKGEFRQQLDFLQPFNGKRKRVFRMTVSPSTIAYLRERLDRAEDQMREQFNEAFK